jgi:hypothetical protein
VLESGHEVLGEAAMKNTAAFLALLFLLGCSRGNGRADSNGVVHAAEAPPAKWVKNEIPLTVFRDEGRGYGSASARGFWQSTSADKGKQLAWPIAVKIECDREAKVCREADATVQLGLLEPELVEYEISSWNGSGILADDTEECNRHSLAIDFKTNSVTVTDYPIKKGDSVCKPLHDANSYALHGGQLQLYPPAPWNP